MFSYIGTADYNVMIFCSYTIIIDNHSSSNHTFSNTIINSRILKWNNTFLNTIDYGNLKYIDSAFSQIKLL